MYIMVRHITEGTEYYPLIYLSFPLLAPHTLVEAEKFNIQYPMPDLIANTADKLRWYRYRKALRQRDVADYAGIFRNTYSSYEETGRDYYPIEKMKLIAELLEVPVTELLDDYNMFLFNGQGKQIREKRIQLNMTQQEYADYLGVNLWNLKDWEQDQVQIVKSTWEKFFK